MGDPVGHLNQSLARLFGFWLFAFRPGEILCRDRIAIIAQIELEKGAHGLTLRQYDAPNRAKGKPKNDPNA